MLNLETIYAALFTQIKTANGNLPQQLKWATTGRWLKHWDDVPANAQPALYLRPGAVDVNEIDYGISKYKIHLYAVIYFKADQTGNDKSHPSQFISQYVSAIFTALQSVPPGEPQTLNGIVEHCRVEGQVHIDDGIAAIDNQAVVAIPIVITTGV